ncbi:MAG TPA: hypothetical protein VK137_12745, partial [Planctomycetaceae bacterium]|nr:hypothetical protein [Planctomycetaceae bacterium]
GKLENARLVLWQPSSEIVRVEQKWLEGVGDWVREGGHVLVAVGVEELDWLSAAAAASEAARKSRKKKADDNATVAVSRSLWELLNLPGVSVSAVGSQLLADVGMPEPLRRPTRDLRDILQDAMKTAATDSERTEYSANASGVFKPLIGDDRKLSLPNGGVFQIRCGDHVPTGTITLPGGTVPGFSDGETCIAARFAVGRGEVTVVSVPALIENSVIGEADNVVVLSKLLTDDGREIVVDEFYHGLAIRGNPMWLFAQRTYGTMTLALLLVIGLVAWRESVFLGTPLAERPVSRRAIREYVEAMARFLREGRGAGPWIVAKLRDGVLWHLRREHGLPPEQHSEERLLAAVERRDPDQAAELSNTLQAVQSLLQAGQAGQERRAIPVMRRMVECLSKNATARCATKSRR